MSTITHPSPVNPAQVVNALGVGCVVRENEAEWEVEADADEQTLRDTVEGIVYDETVGTDPNARAISAVREKANAVITGTDTFTAAQVQKIVARLVLRATRGVE